MVEQGGGTHGVHVGLSMRSLVFGALLTALASQAVAATTANGTVSGQAFVQTSSGTPQTCAGQDDVLLLPQSVAARIEGRFPSEMRGFLPISHGSFAPPEGGRSATCDVQGHFKFGAVAPGAYFLLSKITWAGDQQGGYLMKRVEVAPGEGVETILSARVDDVPPVPQAPHRDPRELAIESAIRAKLFDPNSAEFQWSGRWREDIDFKAWRWSKAVHGDVTCGRVNARNRMGGYVGQSTFLAVVANGAVVQLQMDSTADSEISFPAMMCQKGGFF